MHFPFNVYVAALLAAFLTSALSVPIWRRWCRRTGLVDDPGHRKIHHEPVPLAGGLAVATGILAPIVIAVLFLLVASVHQFGSQAAFSIFGSETVDLLSYGLNRRLWQLIVVLGGAMAMLALGFLDDKHELSPRLKFCGQFLIAIAVAASGIRITLFVESPIFSYTITIFWILTVTNAFNFMDNMNGLCAGLGAIGAWQFALSAALHGQYLVALIALLACGSLLGFLPFNFPRASAFLGDAGSHLTGFLLAVLAILPHFYSAQHQKAWAVLTPLFVLAVPLADLVWVVVLRWRAGRPVYIGDTNHLSHRLVRRGFSRPAAVLLIWLLAAAIGGSALLLAR